MAPPSPTPRRAICARRCAARASGTRRWNRAARADGRPPRAGEVAPRRRAPPSPQAARTPPPRPQLPAGLTPPVPSLRLGGDARPDLATSTRPGVAAPHPPDNTRSCLGTPHLPWIEQTLGAHGVARAIVVGKRPNPQSWSAVVMARPAAAIPALTGRGSPFTALSGAGGLPGHSPPARRRRGVRPGSTAAPRGGRTSREGRADSAAERSPRGAPFLRPGATTPAASG